MLLPIIFTVLSNLRDSRDEDNSITPFTKKYPLAACAQSYGKVRAKVTIFSE
jgi:hypothetical protein